MQSRVSPWHCGLSALMNAGASNDLCPPCYPRPCSCSCVIYFLWPGLVYGSASNHQPQRRQLTVVAMDPRPLLWSFVVFNMT